MKKQTVACIMLANGRAEMVRRAVAAFKAQEYPAKRLLIWNTGPAGDFRDMKIEDEEVGITWSSTPGGIGELRNSANAAALRFWPEVAIFAHWDSDDLSHPRRLVEQVELLENTHGDLVGYREALFFDSRKSGEAWTYRTGNPGAPIGASMMYLRSAWERKPFPPNNTGEDTLWLLHGKFKTMAVPSTWSPAGLPNHHPRIICGVHGGNTSMKSIPQGVAEWKRAPEFDDYCRRRML
jgi:hypothetical protein